MNSIPLSDVSLPSFTVFDKGWFLDREVLRQMYPTNDLHIVYIGEVLAATKA